MRCKLSAYLRLVMFSHTLFSLPYGICALLLIKPRPQRVFLILLALLAARTLANALNRMLDLKFDRLNSRTADRPLCKGEISQGDTLVFSAVCAAVLFLAVLLLEAQLVFLLPFAIFLFAFYALTKRFTAACHFVLGGVCALSVVGTCMACGRPVIWPLAAACAFSVAGFDILYAIEDIDFDRAFMLHSVPASCGARYSVLLAALCFFGSAACIGTVLEIAGLCLYTVFCVALILAFAGAYRAAAYHMNRVAGVIILSVFGIHFIMS